MAAYAGCVESLDYLLAQVNFFSATKSGAAVLNEDAPHDATYV